MSLDTRLRQHYQRAASLAPMTVGPDVLDVIVSRADRRRRRRRVAYTAVLAAAAIVVTAFGLSAGSLHMLGLGKHPVIDRSTLSERYTSAMYPYSIAHPGDWRIVPATRPWLRFPPNERAGQEDQFYASDGSNWAITSIVIPKGESPVDWLRNRALPPPNMPAGCFPPLGQETHVFVDGHRAWIHGGTPNGTICNFIEAYVLVGHRFYQFSAYPSMRTPSDHIYDPQLFQEILDTVHLG